MFLPQSFELLKRGNPPVPRRSVVLWDAQLLRSWFLFLFFLSESCFCPLFFTETQLTCWCTEEDPAKGCSLESPPDWNMYSTKNMQIQLFKPELLALYLFMSGLFPWEHQQVAVKTLVCSSDHTHFDHTKSMLSTAIQCWGRGNLSQDTDFILLTRLRDGWVSRRSFRKWVARRSSPASRRVNNKAQVSCVEHCSASLFQHFR